MTKIASDAMVIQLAVDMAGDGEVQQRLARLNEFIGTLNAKAKAAQDSINLERMSVEGKYNPDIQRDYEIEKAIQLTNKLNLSLETQDAILAEIEEKHKKANQLLTHQYSTGNSPGDDMIAVFRKNQADAAKAEEDLLASRMRAGKLTEKLRDDDLSSYQKYVAQIADAKNLLDKTIIDQEGHDLRVKAARTEYEALQKVEADKAELIQKRTDLEEKAVAEEKALFVARLVALNNSLEEEHRLLQYDTDAYQRSAKAKIEAEEKAARNDLTKQSNANRQKAIGILRSLEDATQRYTRVSDELRSHLAAGDITNEQYAQGLANIERRQRSMSSSMGNVGYMVGNAVTGLEDFVTVLSVTGYGMEGFSAATRSASNNVAQAVRGIGTQAAMLYAPLVSIGMVLVGSAIPAIYRWSTGAEDAAEATKKWRQELEDAVRIARIATDEDLTRLNRDISLRNIQEIETPDQVDRTIRERTDELTRLKNEINGTSAELEKLANKSFESIVTPKTLSDFEKLINGISDESKNLGPAFAELETVMRKELQSIQEDFVANSTTRGSKEAVTELEREMIAFQHEIQGIIDSLPALSRKRILDSAYGTAYSNEMFSFFGSGVDDAAVIDRIQAASEDSLLISRDETEELRKKRAELERYGEEIAALNQRRQEAQNEQQRLERLAMDAELESLRLQQYRSSLIGSENEAERKLLDLAIKRKEIMESGLASPAELEGLFNQELEAIAAELETNLSKIQDQPYSVAVANSTEAYTSANRQMMDAMNQTDNREDEMVELLTAIRDHLSGQNLLQVEIAQ